jgi:hypothetical protein
MFAARGLRVRDSDHDSVTAVADDRRLPNDSEAALHFRSETRDLRDSGHVMIDVVAETATPIALRVMRIRNKSKGGATAGASGRVRAHGGQVAGRDGTRPRRDHATKIELSMRLDDHDRRDHDDSLMIAAGGAPGA